MPPVQDLMNRLTQGEWYTFHLKNGGSFNGKLEGLQERNIQVANESGVTKAFTPDEILDVAPYSPQG